MWLVGGLPFLSPGELPPDLPVAPTSPWGWDHGPYGIIWGAQAAYFVQTNARSSSVLSLDVPQAVDPLEDLPVLLVQGWRGQGDQAPAP